MTPPIVETQYGKLEGESCGAHLRFRGIPYAAPPIGARRFRAPEPPASWTGVRPALAYGKAAPQNVSALPGMAPGPQDEDCLYLNVYTPAADDGRRPVLFWIHGGGFTGGSGGQALYDGGPLAERGDVVVVTINYRLGALGYLHVPDGDANPGQLDQIAALRWVRDNIAAFGGDPAKVTIFGESAGGMAVATLLGMPAAHGLFRGAIAQSGAAHNVHSLESAARARDALLAALGLGASDAAKLRDVPVEKLLAAQAQILVALGRTLGLLPFAPIVEPRTLPRPPLDAVRDGSARDVALMTGTTRDEMKLFHMGMGHADLDPAGLAKRLRAVLRMLRADEARADALIDTYTRARDGRAPTTPAELADALDTDRTFRIPAIRLAEAQRPHQPATYKYLFDWCSPARRGALGACHALELPFVFGTLSAPTMDRFAGKGPDAEALSTRMMDAWLAFAKSANPGWDAYDAERRATQVFAKTDALVHAPLDEERAAWEGIL